jgi:hypothetical protein
VKAATHFSGPIAEEWTAAAQKARRRVALRGAAAAVVAAGLPVVGLWGFTVDDALIPARIAAQLAAGHGYRFNPGGAVVDAVTPLGWAHALVPFAGGGPLPALAAAKWLGAASWLCAAGVLGAQIARAGQRTARFLPLLVLVACAPLAAWAVAGLETGVVTALATLAVTRARWAALAAGAAAALRPELLPWAVSVSFGLAAAERRGPRAIALALASAALPAVGIAIVRLGVFGQAWPLAVLAKPSDLDHGIFYASWALLHTGPPLLVLAPWALPRAGTRAIAIAVAAAVHLIAVALAGGDWMPFYRLVVPVLPSLLLLGAEVAEHAALWATAVRTTLAVAACLLVLVPRAADARQVGARRLALITAARPALAGARSVVALDVGWVGAATEAPIVDLAGLTDPRIATLSGGHTTKRIPEGLLEARGADALVLLVDAPVPPDPWWTARFANGVEQRVAALGAEQPFAPAAAIPLGGTARAYVILRLKPGAVTP